MFKRRRPQTTLGQMGRWFYPRGGWWRAILYMVHRLRRLPDPAYKISRGIAAGVFVSFTPFFGMHFFLAAGLAWLMGGNVLAALLATFVGNPITFPIIAGTAMALGTRMLGMDHPLPLGETLNAFSGVSIELWMNLRGAVTGSAPGFANLNLFLDQIFLPYLVGGLVPGVASGLVAYGVSRPIIAAYQKARIKRLKKKFDKQRRAAKDTATRRAREKE